MSVLIILLTILKIIGLILLTLIGIILLLVLLILFIPIRYEGHFKYDKELDYKAKASWFLKLFSIKIKNENDQMVIQIRAIKKLKDKKENQVKEDVSEEQVKRDSQQSLDEVEVDTFKEKQTEEKIDSISTKVATKENEVKKEIKFESEIKDASEKKQEQKPEVQLGKETEIKQKLKTTKDKQSKKTKKKLSKKTKKKQKESQQPSMLSKIKAIYQHEDRKEVFDSCKRIIIKLLKHIKPRKFDIRLIIGFEDPSHTGYFLALSGMLKPFVDRNNHLHIYGDFNDKIIEGEGYLKGRIYIYYLTYITIKLLANKKVRNYFSFVKRTF